MTKKLSFLIAAAAVLAFAAPSVASAAEATIPAGTRAPVGTKITLAGKNITWTSSFIGPVTCATENLNAEITKNDGTTVEADGNSVATTSAACQNGSPERPIPMTEIRVTKLLANGTATSGTKTGTLSFSTKWDYPQFSCTYTGTNVQFSYTSGTDVIKFDKATGIVADKGCGSAKLDGEFTLERSGTTSPVFLD